MFRLEEIEPGHFSCQVESLSMDEEETIQSLKRLNPQAVIDMRLFSKHTRLLSIYTTTYSPHTRQRQQQQQQRLVHSRPCSCVERILWTLGCLMLVIGLGYEHIFLI